MICEEQMFLQGHNFKNVWVWYDALYFPTTPATLSPRELGLSSENHLNHCSGEEP